MFFADNTKAWELQPDGSYSKLQPGYEKPISAQLELMKVAQSQSNRQLQQQSSRKTWWTRLKDRFF